MLHGRGSRVNVTYHYFAVPRERVAALAIRRRHFFLEVKMSYEGYTEYLCENGHHWQVDAHAENDDTACPRCKRPAVWSHNVDETNGIEFDEEGNPDPATVPYPLEVSGHEEVVVRVPIYKIPSHEDNLNRA